MSRLYSHPHECRKILLANYLCVGFVPRGTQNFLQHDQFGSPFLTAMFRRHGRKVRRRFGDFFGRFSASNFLRRAKIHTRHFSRKGVAWAGVLPSSQAKRIKEEEKHALTSCIFFLQFSGDLSHSLPVSGAGHPSTLTLEGGASTGAGAA